LHASPGVRLCGKKRDSFYAAPENYHFHFQLPENGKRAVVVHGPDVKGGITRAINFCFNL
jgi:hypothetical protein